MHKKIFVGNNLDYLKTLADNSIDSVVTDPPYGLGKEPDPLEVIQAWAAGEEYKASGGGFMGHDWDSFVPSPAVWKECYRVLKPGGHILAFGGTRTYDWIVLGVRLAGFEIRDMLAWISSQGMPKGLNISKAIDNSLGLERPVIGMRVYGNGKEYPGGEFSGRSGGGIMGDAAARGPGLVTSPASDEAARWEGWNTGLKPAIEPIVMGRKPLSGTMIDNVLRHGVGGINIGACRVPVTGEHKDRSEDASPDRSYVSEGSTNFAQRPGPRGGSADGRYPSNVIHDGSDTVVSHFPHTESGVMAAGSVRNSDKSRNAYGSWEEHVVETDTYGDKGTAARYYNVAPFDPEIDAPFMYCAKTSSKERHAGLEAPKSQFKHGDTLRKIENAVDGAEGKKGNYHPTVKPMALMQWLVKLVTPAGGLVFDPYLGSGTTALACVKEGFDWRGCEISEEYAEITSQRVEHMEQETYNPFGF